MKRHIWLVWQTAAVPQRYYQYAWEELTLEKDLQGCYNTEECAIKVASNLNRIYGPNESWVESWELSDD